MAKVYPVTIEVELDGSGAGEATFTLNGALLCYNLARSSGSPVVTITDGYATPVDGVAHAANGQFHPHAPVLDADGVAGTTTTLYLFTVAHDVTITVTSGDTTDGTVTVEFFMVDL
jgi:hypothetical protein